jgi:GNAT superfamily N-acetyltransferase
MSEELTIRDATILDVDSMSELIIRTVRESNARDYTPAVIAEVIDNFSPERITARMEGRKVFVACMDDEIVGTASPDGVNVRSVFVSPGRQGHGVGSALMRHVEDLAARLGLSRLEVPVSVTAEGFYLKLDYKFVRDEYREEERIIVMEKMI